MRTLALLLAASTLLAGCLRGDDASPAGGAEAPTIEQEALAPAPEETSAPPPEPRTVDVAFDGNVGTSVAACVLDAVGRCAFVPVAKGNSGLLLEGETGRILGGALTLIWDAASPATQELSAGFMLMDGGDACESMNLGDTKGPSPLTLAIEAAPRPLCAGEIVHLWVAGTTWGAQGPAYYQADLDQAFRVEGSFTLAEDGPAAAAQPRGGSG